ncbi:hypothetical protein D5086_017752 [Populus alba]|uniref:Uncharacterized protein n=1 Tax=Populus alba TaxID=43335 RepID=A0ACC4BNF3_POPAL
MGHQSNTTKAISLAVVGQFSEQMPASLSSGSTSQAQEACHGLGVYIPRPLMIYAERETSASTWTTSGLNGGGDSRGAFFFLGS